MSQKTPTFDDPPDDVVDAFPTAHYQVDVRLDAIADHVRREMEVGLDVDPPFQRAHVWTSAQQAAFCEHILRGGETGITLVAGHVGDLRERPDGTCYFKHYCLIDGKQRLEAVTQFQNDEFPIFAHPGKPGGYFYSGLGPRFRRLHVRLQWRVLKLSSYGEILRQYLRMNSGGTAHTEGELDTVREMLGALTPSTG